MVTLPFNVTHGNNARTNHGSITFIPNPSAVTTGSFYVCRKNLGGTQIFNYAIDASLNLAANLMPNDLILTDSGSAVQPHVKYKFLAGKVLDLDSNGNFTGIADHTGTLAVDTGNPGGASDETDAWDSGSSQGDGHHHYGSET